jgi:hypothetical protein
LLKWILVVKKERRVVVDCQKVRIKILLNK